MHEIGNLFNPMIFAFITGFTRAQLYNFIRKNDKTRCDSAAIPADVVANLISNEEIEWFDEESYEPESDL